MPERTQPPSLVCPLTDISYFESAVTMVIESGYDSSLPWEERLYKLAGAAVGFALRIGCEYPEELEGLLASYYHTSSAARAGDEARDFLSAFTSPTTQKGLVECAREAGAPPLAVLVLIIVRYTRSLATMGGALVELEAARRMTGFFLRSVLLLARDYPGIARTYRDLVPG